MVEQTVLIPPGHEVVRNRITARTLQRLRKIGPGGVVVLHKWEHRFHVTHSQAILLHETPRVIVYGYGNLVDDEDYYGDSTSPEGLAAGADETVRFLLTCCWSSVPRVSQSLTLFRVAMQNQRFHLDRRPQRFRDAGRQVVRDHYVWAANPDVRVTTKVELDERPQRRIVARVYDRNGQVRAWPVHFPQWSSATPCAGAIAAFVRSHTPRT